IIQFVIDRLGKKSGTGVSPAAFWSLFRRGKSDPGPGRGGPGAIEQHGAHSVEKIPLAGGAGSKPNEKGRYHMDRLVRAITTDGMVQAVAVSTRDLTERARNIHTTLPVATAALGRALAAASMMGNALKVDDARLPLQLEGGGALGTVLTVSGAQGNVRGYVQQPHVDLPLRPDGKLDVGSAVGSDGTLTVIKDLGMKEPYIGSGQLLGGEIAEDLAAYFVES